MKDTKFIYTQDKQMADKLIANGLMFVSGNNGNYVFLNDVSKLHFAGMDDSKLHFTNILHI